MLGTLKTGLDYTDGSFWASSSASYLVGLLNFEGIRGCSVLLCQNKRTSTQKRKKKEKKARTFLVPRSNSVASVTGSNPTRQHAEATHQPPLTHHARGNVSISRTFQYTPESPPSQLNSNWRFGAAGISIHERVQVPHDAPVPTAPQSRSHPTAETRRNILELLPGHTNL